MKRRCVRQAMLVLSLCGVAAAQGPERGCAEITLKGKKVTVEYGRPPLAGRTLEELIAQLPEDRVWRAGFNDVTTLTTEANLKLGGKRVPAGRYSVYVYAPKSGDWSLILNSDPGIELGAFAKAMGFPIPDRDARRRWPHLEGYHTGNPGKGIPAVADQEVARGTMRSGTVTSPTDPFTIALGPAPSGGLTMTLAWAERTWSADFEPGEQSGSGTAQRGWCDGVVAPERALGTSSSGSLPRAKLRLEP